MIIAINELISTGKIERTEKWTTSSTDEKARKQRAKAAERAGKQAEKAAQELGVWDEFFGSGEKGKRKGMSEEDDGRNGEGGLALTIAKRQREREGGLDRLEEKYRRMEEEERERKRARGKKGRKEVEEAANPPV